MIPAERALGANQPAGTVRLVLFVPSIDRQGAAIEQVFWREEALRMLETLFRGATAFPPGRGCGGTTLKGVRWSSMIPSW